MNIFDDMPIMNAYSVNLDWIFKKIRELEEFVRNYAAVNNVAYAGVWDITKQYPQWALVTDGDTSWLSLRPVPKGIPLENVDYWQKLADLDPRISGIVTQLADIDKRIGGIVTQLGSIEERVARMPKKADNVADMKSTDCIPGDIIQTMGYHKKGIGPGLYVVESEAAANERNIIALNNGLFAVLLDNPSNVLTIGAHADGETDDTEVFQWAVDNLQIVYAPSGKYLISGTIDITKSCVMYGDKTTLDFEPSQNRSGTLLYCNSGIVIEAEGVEIHDICFFKNIQTGKGTFAIKIHKSECHHVNLKRILIEDFENGIVVNGTIFESVFESLLINGCTNGFYIDGTATSTSCTWLNCWTTWCDNGYWLNEVIYSNMFSCASDHCKIGYRFGKLQNFNCIGCGCETSTSETDTCVIIVDSSFCDFNFFFSGNNGPYPISCATSSHIIFSNCNALNHAKKCDYIIGDWSPAGSCNIAYNTNPGTSGATRNIINSSSEEFQTLATKA